MSISFPNCITEILLPVIKTTSLCLNPTGILIAITLQHFLSNETLFSLGFQDSTPGVNKVFLYGDQIVILESVGQFLLQLLNYAIMVWKQL